VRALSDRVSKASDVATITDLTGLPVLAQVPRGRGPEVVEAFRTLRTNLMFLEGAGQPRTIALLSPNADAGKSFCSIRLAESAIAVDAQVVLVDADLRRPVLHERLRVDREPGLTDVLRGTPLAKALHAVDGYQNLRVLSSGSQVSDTVAALGGRSLQDVLDALDDAELIVVDTPPGDYADALAVAAQCDAALLVLDAQTTRRRATRQFIEALERTGASLIGVILNNASVSKRATYDRS
jgi:capsular exopolysaccharide synthesis family protein